LTGLGQTHGYCFDGDFVHLNAEVSLDESDLTPGESWSLELWASETGFADAALNGVKVAEMAIEPLAGAFSLAACCHALPPLGATEQSIGLALVSRNGDGAPQVRDLAVYPTPERFLQPRLLGDVRCTLTDDCATLSIEAIANPRGADNLSGTLALEVWSLDAPYAGGDWTGAPVASVVIGTLAGGNEWTACTYSVPAAAPADGAALTIMLREWTPAGYVTRDCRNLPGTAKVKTVKTVAPKARDAKLEKGAKVGEKAAKEAAAPLPKAEKKPGKDKAKAAIVAVNTASEAELKAIKGLSGNVAKAIIAGRPYATLDDLCRAKGMGAKLLAKLRDQFKL
jgi:DNA uptake protein ComE-like DNA-binding protein